MHMENPDLAGAVNRIRDCNQLEELLDLSKIETQISCWGGREVTHCAYSGSMLLDELAQKALDLNALRRLQRQPFHEGVVKRIQTLYHTSAIDSREACCVVGLFCATRDMWQQNCFRWGYGPRFHYDVRL